MGVMGVNDIFTEEREQIILKILKEKKRITVPELADLFNISVSTIRRQLNVMGKEGKLIRTHGGAISIDEASNEDIIEKKRTGMMSQKKLIALEARKYINDGDILLLGSGTTVLELAKVLHDLKKSIVITNSILVAYELYKNTDIEVRISGGTIREKTCSLVGPQAEKYFEDAFVDKAFIGSDAISIEYGLTTPSTLEAEIVKKIVKYSKTVFVLADHTKMQNITLVKEASLEDIDYIITDADADKTFLDQLRKAGVEIVVTQS